MNMICNKLDKNIVKYSQINKTVKIALCFFSLVATYGIFINVLDIFSVNSQILNQKAVLNSLDKDLLLELNLWSEIDYSHINMFDFRYLLEKHLQDQKYGKVQNVIMTLDEDSNELLIKSIKSND